MSVWHDFIRRLEQDLAECRSDLELLESGRMQNRERRDGGAWVDTTQRELDCIRKRLVCTRFSYVNFARSTEGKTYRDRAPAIRLRRSRRAVHGKAQGRATTGAALSPLCDGSGGDPVRRRGASGHARIGRLDAGR